MIGFPLFQPRDKILLHDYLNGKLPDAARVKFEQKLSQDAGLRKQFAELQTIKKLLQILPMQPTPRAYAIDPSMIGVHPPKPLSLRFAQSSLLLVTLVFVLYVGGTQAKLFSLDRIETCQTCVGQELPQAALFSAEPEAFSAEAQLPAPQPEATAAIAAVPMLDSVADAQTQPVPEISAKMMPAPDLQLTVEGASTKQNDRFILITLGIIMILMFVLQAFLERRITTRWLKKYRK